MPRVLQLTYSASGVDLGPLKLAMLTNHSKLRAELDAYYVVVCSLTRDERRYIPDSADVMGEDCSFETFRVRMNNEFREFGKYRTQRLVREASRRAPPVVAAGREKRISSS